MIYIVGSGPSAISALQACINQGKAVTVLDVGFTKDHDFGQNINRPNSSAGFPLKTTYGSDYPYWRPQNHRELEENPDQILSSFAQGGFSSVWGAGLLPYSEKEFSDWPIDYKDLLPYYHKLHDFLPISGRTDQLSNQFPLFSQRVSPLKSSTQFEKIFNAFERHQDQLIQAGLSIGQSRLAIQQNPQPCIYCGQCIDGCPKHIIYSSAHTLQEVLSSPLVTYLDGIKVEKLVSKLGEIDIEAFDIKNRKSVFFQAEKVFLGSGVISSSKILLRSLGAHNQPLTIKDSQYFLFPAIGPYTSKILNEDVFTLAQAFLEIEHPAFFQDRIHLSLYGYSAYLRDFAYQKFGPLSPLLTPGLNYGLKRAFIAQGFLPSSASNQISIRLQKGSKDHFIIQTQKTQEVKKVINRIIKKLNRHRKQTGLWAIRPLLNIAPIGKSFHLGGSFPMRSNPKNEFETNYLGESPGMPNVHVIDSSIFPDIASGPITYTIMANAYRITETALTQ